MPVAVVVSHVDTRARACSDLQKGITPCSTSKANPPHSGLDRLCYKNWPFVSSGYLQRSGQVALRDRQWQTGVVMDEKAQNLIGNVSSLLPLIVNNALNALAAILILLIG